MEVTRDSYAFDKSQNGCDVREDEDNEALVVGREPRRLDFRTESVKDAEYLWIVGQGNKFGN